GYDRQARLWSAASGEILARLAHEDAVIRVEFSPDGSRLVTGSLDGTAALWRAADGERLQVLAHESPVQAIQFAPRGGEIVTVTVNEAVRLWSASGTLLSTLREPGAPHIKPAGSVAAFSPDGALLAVGLQDGSVQL